MPAFTPAATAPAWFLENLQQPGTSRYVRYGESRVHFLGWNWDDPSLPALLLVHGFGGHTRWWSYLAPFFSDRYRVAAMDLPGMGDSSPPPRYDDGCYANGILELVRGEGLRDVTIVGHSFGGLQTMRALVQAQQLFRQAIVVDSLVCLPPAEPPPVFEPRGSHRHYGSLDECMARFRLVPEQPRTNLEIIDFIAYHSCRLSERGWHWKFDPKIANYGEMKDFEALRGISLRADCIYGELSLFNQNDEPARLLEYFGNPGEAIIVPGAHHHLMIDHPLELVAAINRLLLPLDD